jgi:two-component system, OmpR family, sensor histidine kinase KdpD
LSSIIDSAIAQLQALTIEHKLELDVPVKLPPIFGDELRIAQVLTNLVGNAVKYSPPQTQITISAHRAGKLVKVSVADQGPGVPQQDSIRIFEAFRQLENETSNRTKGAGLGLAICKGLIEAHGGQIWIQNHDGPGTIISFTIPIWSETKK